MKNYQLLLVIFVSAFVAAAPSRLDPSYYFNEDYRFSEDKKTLIRISPADQTSPHQTQGSAVTQARPNAYASSSSAQPFNPIPRQSQDTSSRRPFDPVFQDLASSSKLSWRRRPNGDIWCIVCQKSFKTKEDWEDHFSPPNDSGFCPDCRVYFTFLKDHRDRKMCHCYDQIDNWFQSRG